MVTGPKDMPDMDQPYARALYAGFFSLGIDELGEGKFLGKLGHFFFRKLLPVYSLDDTIYKMECLMNRLGYPEASRAGRHFRLDGIGMTEKQIELAERRMADIALSRTQLQEENEFARGNGKQMNFLITVSWRDHGCWQGNVVWFRKRRQNRKENFGSVLELMQLIWSAVAIEEADRAAPEAAVQTGGLKENRIWDEKKMQGERTEDEPDFTERFAGNLPKQKT